MDPDAGLIRRMHQGEDEAIEAFVRKYYPQILGYCCYHLRHRQDGEDVTQETFARLDVYKRQQKRWPSLPSCTRAAMSGSPSGMTRCWGLSLIHIYLPIQKGGYDHANFSH